MDHIEKLIQRYKALAICRESIAAAAELICHAYALGNKVLVCGNGGSFADAEHIVGELMKGFLSRRPLSTAEQDAISRTFPEEGAHIAANLQRAVPAIVLNAGGSLGTAFANDVNPEFVFAQQVFGLGNEGDILICLTTSGNSKNIIRAAQLARYKKMKVLSLTGQHGGTIRKYSDIPINVPSDITPEIQELHLPVYHAICAEVEERIFQAVKGVRVISGTHMTAHTPSSAPVH